jgi:large subunit ribosomal protein L25
MARTFQIDCKKRPEGSKPNALRRSGWIPATIYGHNGTESVQVVVNAKAAEFLIRDAILQKSLVEVTVEDMNWKTGTVLQEVQKHPWKGSIYHISFLAAKG